MKWLALALSVVTLAAVSPMRTAGYVYEDRGWFPQMASPPVVTARALTNGSWWLVGDRPRAQHALSLALHATVAGLAGLLAVRLGLSRLAALFVAGLILLHPLNSEAAFYLSARSELFAAIGVLGACLAATWRSGWRWLVIPGALLFGLAGKESAVVGLALVPLVLWVRQDRQWRPAALLSLAAGVLVAAQFGAWANIVNRGEIGTMQVDALPWLLAQSAAAYRLILQSVVPMGLTVDPDIDAVTLTARALALLMLTSLTVIAWRQRHTRPMLTFGLAWLLLALLPRLIVQTPRSYLNAHQAYLPLMGLWFLAASQWDALGQWAHARQPHTVTPGQFTDAGEYASRHA